MPCPTTREEVLARLRKTVADGSIIVGAGAGEITLFSPEIYQSFMLILFQALVSLQKQSSPADATSSSSTTRADSEWPAEAH